MTKKHFGGKKKKKRLVLGICKICFLGMMMLEGEMRSFCPISVLTCFKVRLDGVIGPEAPSLPSF